MSVASRLQKLSSSEKDRQIHPTTKAMMAGTLATAGLLGGASTVYGVKALINKIKSVKPYYELNALNLVRNNRAGTVALPEFLRNSPMNLLTDDEIKSGIKIANDTIEKNQAKMYSAGRKSALLGVASLPVAATGFTAASEFQRVQNAKEKQNDPRGSNPVNVMHGPQLRMWQYS
jgi:hypothetical protein